MRSLHTLQNLFYDAMLDGPVNNPAIAQLAQEVTEKEKITQEEQITIYRDSVIAGMANALAQIFPVCQKLVGDEFFDMMATQYAYHEHSISPDIGDYGINLPTFITNLKAAESVPYLADVAKLEWFWHKAFNAEDDQANNLQDMANLTAYEQEKLVFSLSKSQSLMASKFPISLIWEANQDKTDLQAEEIDLQQAEYLIIWRNGFEMRIDRLPEEQWLFLNVLQTKKPFPQVCENCLATNPNLEIPQLLAQAVQNGWITKFIIEN